MPAVRLFGQALLADAQAKPSVLMAEAGITGVPKVVDNASGQSWATLVSQLQVPLAV